MKLPWSFPMFSTCLQSKKRSSLIYKHIASRPQELSLFLSISRHSFVFPRGKMRTSCSGPDFFFFCTRSEAFHPRLRLSVCFFIRDSIPLMCLRETRYHLVVINSPWHRLLRPLAASRLPRCWANSQGLRKLWNKPWATLLCRVVFVLCTYEKPRYCIRKN